MPGPLTADDRHARERAEALYMMGIPSLDIAAQLGLKRERVRQWVVRGDWFNRKKVQQANQAQIVNKALVNHVTDAVLGHQRKISKLVESKLGSLENAIALEPKHHVELATALKTLDDVGRRNLGMDSESEQSKRSTTFNFNLRAAQVERVVEVETSNTSSDNQADSTQAIE